MGRRLGLDGAERAGRTRGRRCAVLLGVVLASVPALAPTAAHASCLPLRPRDSLGQYPAAFIGRFVERQTDGRLLYRVDERLKGPLGPTVLVRDEVYPATASSIGVLGATPDVDYAMVLRRDADGFMSNGCLQFPVAALRAARSSRLTSCSRPMVTALVTRSRPGSRTLHVDVTVEDRDGFPSGAQITWGDGETLDVRLPRRAARRRTVSRSHRYGSPGRYALRIVARARPAGVDCLAFGSVDLPSYGLRARPVRVG